MGAEVIAVVLGDSKNIWIDSYKLLAAFGFVVRIRRRSGNGRNASVLSGS